MGRQTLERFNINFEISGDCADHIRARNHGGQGAGRGNTPRTSTTQATANLERKTKATDRYKSMIAQEYMKSGKGTSIYAGDEYYECYVAGYAILSKEDLMMEKLKRDIAHPTID